MCSCRTDVPMIACLTIPGFSLRVPLLRRPELSGKPVALAPVPGTWPPRVVHSRRPRGRGWPGCCSPEALATCPRLELVEQIRAGVEEGLGGRCGGSRGGPRSSRPSRGACTSRRVGSSGWPGPAGGAAARARRGRGGVGGSCGGRPRRFAALAAATAAPAGRALVIDTARRASPRAAAGSTAPPLSPERREELSELGVKRLGELARLPGAAVADRLGADGAQAWSSPGRRGRLGRPAPPPAEIAETLTPEPVANEQTPCGRWRRRRAPACPPGAGRLPFAAARPLGEARRRRLLAALAERCASRRRSPTASARAGRPLAELPAPTAELRLELGELTESVGTQTELVRPRGSRLRERLRVGLRQARAAVGSADAVCTVVEVAPWSRIPRPGPSSFRATTEPTAPRARGLRERDAGGRRQGARGRAARGVAGGRPLRTEEPVNGYFEALLETGRNVVVFRDEASGEWFRQSA